jgi:hypothetical protein
MIPVIGLAMINNLYLLFSKPDKGKITGEVNISNCIPNVSRCIKSLYLVVNEETIIPVPSPKRPIRATRTGKRRSNELGAMAEPLIRK